MQRECARHMAKFVGAIVPTVKHHIVCNIYDSYSICVCLAYFMTHLAVKIHVACSRLIENDFRLMISFSCTSFKRSEVKLKTCSQNHAELIALAVCEFSIPSSEKYFIAHGNRQLNAGEKYDFMRNIFDKFANTRNFVLLHRAVQYNIV